MLNAMGTAVPPPPPLTGNVDPSKIDEIRRTIYVGNLNTTVSCAHVQGRESVRERGKCEGEDECEGAGEV